MQAGEALPLQSSDTALYGTPQPSPHQLSFSPAPTPLPVPLSSQLPLHPPIPPLLPQAQVDLIAALNGSNSLGPAFTPNDQVAQSTIGGLPSLPASYSHGELAGLVAAGGLGSFALPPGVPYGNGNGSLQGGVSTPAARNPAMDLEHVYGSPSSSAASTPAAAPRSYAYYPPLASAPLPHPAVQRHHPYAHPAHVRAAPPSLPHSLSSNSLYFATQSGPPTSIPTDVPPTLGSPLGLGFPSTAPLPHRVHSAPTHTLSLSTKGLSDGMGRMISMTPEVSDRFEGMAGMEDGMGGEGYESSWDPTQSLGAGGARDWDEDRSMIERPLSATTIKVKDEQHQPAGYFDSSFLPQQSNYPAPSSLASVISPGTNGGPHHESAVPAIALLRNRLPILEAALSVSASAPGEDEEEIWKGVEGAFEELKRVIHGRMDSRRELMNQRDGKRFYTAMEMESSASSDRGISVSKFLASQIHPPLVHSQSTPDIPISAQANVARAQAQLQASQLQLQQAQIQQAQAQHVLAHQAQVEAIARVEGQVQAEARLRADAEVRARAEEARLRVEADNHARAVAEEDARQQELYQQQQHQLMLQQAQLQLVQQQAIQQQQEAALAQQQRQEAALAHQQHQQQQIDLAQMQHARDLAASAQAQSQQQPIRYSSPPAFAAQQYSAASSPTAPISTNHSLHPSHTPSPLSSIIPSRQPSTQHTLSQPSTPMTINPSQIGLGYGSPSNYDTSMGAVMQMHMGANPYGVDGLGGMETQQGVSLAELETVQPSLISLPSTADREPWTNGTTEHAIVAERGSLSPRPYAAKLSPTLGSGLVLTPPPSATSSSRPSRSRAASSTTGSRSRAESGSGFQSLMESRSRAASSASSAFYNNLEIEKETDDEVTDVEGGDSDMAFSRNADAADVPSTEEEEDLKPLLDPIFLSWLSDVCSDLDATDSKGELIHQLLMASKMQKLDESSDFRPFKFRIQAFTNAFAEKIAESGVAELEDTPLREIRQYLWSQPTISRFNDDGKKSKSKGNHIWTVEAKKLDETGTKWEFRQFVSCIKIVPSTTAWIGGEWSWSPRIWSPLATLVQSSATWSATGLPSWLSWNGSILSGSPPESVHGERSEIVAKATFSVNKVPTELELSFPLKVLRYGEQDVEPTVEAVPAEAIESSAASTPFHSPKADDIAVFPSSTLLPSLLPALGLLNFNSVAPSPHMQSTNSASGFPQSPQQSMESTEGLRLHMQLQANEAARLQQHSQFLQFQAESQGQMELDANHHHLASLQSQATHQYVPPPAELVAQALQQAHFDRSRTDYAPMMMDHPLLSNTGGTPSLAPTMTMADSQQLSDFALSLPNSFVSQQ